MPKILGVRENQDLTWSTSVKIGYDRIIHRLTSRETWVVLRIYADRLDTGSDNPVDWGDVQISMIYNFNPIFTSHLSHIGRTLGDLGDKIAKLLDKNDPEDLLQRLGAEPHLFATRVAGILKKPIMFKANDEFEIHIKGQLLQNIRICFSGIQKLDVL